MITRYTFSFLLVMSLDIRVRASVDLPQSSAETKTTEILSFISSGQLLTGAHWIRKTTKYGLQTPFGDIESLNGDFYVRYVDSRVTVVNHLGELKVKLRDGSIVQVPPGFEFWFSEIKKDKKNKMGFIKPLDMKDHIQILGKMWHLDQNSFKEQMLKFQSRWGDRAAMAAEYYKGLAQRKIASVQKEESRVQILKQREINRRQANRKLLFERAFGR